MSKKMSISSMPIIKEDNAKTLNIKTNINNPNKIKNISGELKQENDKKEEEDDNEEEEKVESEDQEKPENYAEEKVENEVEEKGENEEEDIEEEKEEENEEEKEEEEKEEEVKNDSSKKIVKNKINLEMDSRNASKKSINIIENKSKKNINAGIQINIKKDINYKLKAEALEKENSEIKINLNQKEEEIAKLSKINEKLRKNLEKVSVQVDTLLKKVNDNALYHKKAKNLSPDNNEKNNSNDNDSLAKEKQLKSSLSMIHYLTKDNKKLRKQIESLNQLSPIDPHNVELLKKKEEEINTLSEENKKLKEEINQLKYSEKTIENLKKKIIILNDTINRLNEKNDSIKEENKNYKLQINNNIGDINSNANNNISNISDNKLKQITQNNHNKKHTKLLIQSSENMAKPKRIIFNERSTSVKNLVKRNIKFCSTTKHFYKLFNESEQKAISTLFESKEDLDNFKQKINILENRNSFSEKQLNNEIKGLKKAINEKDEQIKYLNIKIKGDNAKINSLKNNNSKELINKTLKENRSKNKSPEVERNLRAFGFKEKSKTKNEQIEKLNLIIEGLKKELNKYYYEKSKEKEIDNLNIEIGLQGLVDVKKIVSDKTKKFKQKILKVTKNEVDIFLKGVPPPAPKTNPNKEKDTKSVKLFRNSTNDYKRVASINSRNNNRKTTTRVYRTNNNIFSTFHQKKK